MGDRTADTSEEVARFHNGDRAFAIGFATVILLAMSAWLSALMWLAWQPLHYLISCVFD